LSEKRINADKIKPLFSHDLLLLWQKRAQERNEREICKDIKEEKSFKKLF
jgi:hypothetical protein